MCEIFTEEEKKKAKEKEEEYKDYGRMSGGII